MMRLPAAFLVLLAASAALAGERPQAEEIRYVMGTTATVKAWAPDSANAEEAVEAAFAAFDRTDSLMSTWRDDSMLSRLNAAGPGRWVPVGPEVCRVLEQAKQVAAATAGAFDPTVLPLVRLWGFRGGAVEVPDSLALVAVLESVGHEFLEVDTAGGRARLLDAGAAIDLGGIAKGHALDTAAAAMRSAGARGGVLDLGGNVLVFGSGPGRQVGIVDPRADDRLLAAIPLKDAAAATSGQYERFLTIQGRRYGHILDPRTGWPVAPGVSVTVVADRAVLADALATAAVVLGPEQGLALLERTPGVEGVLAVGDENGGCRLHATSGYEAVREDPGRAHKLQSKSGKGKLKHIP